MLRPCRCNEGYEAYPKAEGRTYDFESTLYRERIEAGLDMPSEFFHTFVKDQTKNKPEIMNHKTRRKEK